MWDLSSPTRARTRVPGIGRRSLNHWTTREVPLEFFFFLVALGLHCCTQAFSSFGEQGLPFVVVCGLLIVVASLVAEHGL